MHTPPLPPPRTNYFSSVFQTRNQLEARIKALEKENEFLRKQSGIIAVASPGSGPCTCCTATSKTLQSILTKYGAP